MPTIPPSDLLQAAQAVIKNAYAPYSRLPVAAAVRAKNGDVFAACNVENAAFPMGICAESGAISALIANGHRDITEALVLVTHKKICPPCGACRQRLLEFASTDFPVHLCTTSGDYQQHTLHDLLPFAFGPNNLENP